jgi:hypothetical protein
MIETSPTSRDFPALLTAFVDLNRGFGTETVACEDVPGRPAKKRRVRKSNQTYSNTPPTIGAQHGINVERL